MLGHIIIVELIILKEKLLWHRGVRLSENQKGGLGWLKIKNIVDLEWVKIKKVFWVSIWGGAWLREELLATKTRWRGGVLQDLIKTSMNGCYYRCSCQLKEYEVWRKGHIDKNVEDVLKLIFDSHQIYRMYFRWIEVSQCLGWNKIPEAKPKEYIS